MKDHTNNADERRFEPRGADGPDGDEGLVGRLLQLADSGPEIPVDGADRVREAIRPAWRREVRARSRRRFLWGGGALAAAVAVFALVMVFVLDRSGPVGANHAAEMVIAQGTIEVFPPSGAAESFGEGDAGVRILSGSTLRTGESSRASFTLTGGGSLRMDVRTEFTLDSAVAVALAVGSVYLDSEGSDGEGVAVRTTFGTAREIGTQFEVRRDDAGLVVRVREGRVALSRDTEDIVIDQGTALAIAPDGSKSAAVISSYDPAWDWTQSVAPVFDMEGRTAADLLDWVSRETGLWVSFDSPEVESAARDAVLHGSLAGISPAEAPALVLPGCGLEAIRGTGTLTIGYLFNGVRDASGPVKETPPS